MTLLRRFLALLVALALAVAAGLTIIETVGIRIGESPLLVPVDDWARRLSTGGWSEWDADAWTIASAIALGVGLLLVVLQLIPHRKTTVERRTIEGRRAVRFGRNGLHDRLSDIVVDQDGVLEGDADVSKRSTKVQAGIPAGTDPNPAEQSVRTVVRDELDRLQLATKDRLKVDVVHTKDRVV
jgi:hypothetical protein